MLNYQHFKKWCFIALACIASTTYASPGGWLSLKIVNLSNQALTVQATSAQNVSQLQPRGDIILQPSQSVTFKGVGVGSTSCSYLNGCPDEYFEVAYKTASATNKLIYDFNCTGCNDEGGTSGNWTMRVIDQSGAGYQNWFAMCGTAGWSAWPNGGRCDQNGDLSDFAYNFIISGHQVDAWAVAYYKPFAQ